MSIYINPAHKEIDVTDDVLSHLSPNIAIHERKDGEDVVTYEDVVTPTEHTYTTIERVQTGTKTVFDSSTEKFGWSNLRFTNYEIIDEPNTNNGRKMYVAHFTAQLSDGATHSLQYRLTFNPKFVNSYNLNNGKLWLAAKTNYVLTIYVDIFDVTENKRVEGDVEITMTDLDNHLGNFSGIWEGISTTSSSSFVKASYGTPKKTSWHNQEWYSGNNNLPGGGGGAITLKVNLRDSFTHAFDYVLVNGAGYSAGFGVQDLNLAEMTKVTTTSHEVPVYEDREVTHTETIDVHTTVEHVTPAPIIKSIVREYNEVQAKIFEWDCDTCSYRQSDRIVWGHYGWLMDDASINWGKFVTDKINYSHLKNIPQFIDDGEQVINNLQVTKPYYLSDIVVRNGDKLIAGQPVAYTNIQVDRSNTGFNSNGEYNCTFTASLDGVIQTIEFRVKMTLANTSNSSISQSGNLWISGKVGKPVEVYMELFNITQNKTISGVVNYVANDLDNEDPTFRDRTKFWEGVKPTQYSKYLRGLNGTKVLYHSGFYTTNKATGGASVSAGEIEFSVDLQENGYTHAFTYEAFNQADWAFSISIHDLGLDDMKTVVEKHVDDYIEVYLDTCCVGCKSQGMKSCGCGCSEVSKDAEPGEFQFLEDYQVECSHLEKVKNGCDYNIHKVEVPDKPCGEQCSPCWEKRIKDKFTFDSCWPEFITNRCYRFNYGYPNKREMYQIIVEWYNDNKDMFINWLKTYEFDGRETPCGFRMDLSGTHKTIIDNMNGIKLTLDGKIDWNFVLYNLRDLTTGEVRKLKGV